MVTIVRGKQNSILRQLCSIHWLLLSYPILIQVIARPRAAEESLELDRSAKLQIVLTGLYGIYAFIKFFCGSKEKARQYFRSPLIWMSVYVLTMLASTYWSVNPKLTLFRSLQLIIFYLLGVESLRTLPDTIHRVKYFILFALSLIIADLLRLMSNQFFLSKPGLTTLHGFGHPDALVIAVILCFLVKAKLWKSIMLFMFIMILISTSAKAYIGLILALATYMLITTTPYRKWLHYILFIGIILVAFFPTTIKSMIFPGRTESRITSGTGRIFVWEAILRDYVVSRPFLGHGYSASEQSLYVESHYGFQVINSHSVYLGSLLGGGIIGLTTLLIVFAVAFRGATTITQTNQKAAFTVALVAMTVIGTTQSLFSSRVSGGGMAHLLLLCLVLLSCQTKPHARPTWEFQ